MSGPPAFSVRSPFGNEGKPTSCAERAIYLDVEPDSVTRQDTKVAFADVVHEIVAVGIHGRDAAVAIEHELHHSKRHNPLAAGPAR